MLHYGIVVASVTDSLRQYRSQFRTKGWSGALGTMGEGMCTCSLRILFTAEVLCMLAFLVLMAGIASELGAGR